MHNYTSDNAKATVVKCPGDHWTLKTKECSMQEKYGMHTQTKVNGIHHETTIANNLHCSISSLELLLWMTLMHP